MRAGVRIRGCGVSHRRFPGEGDKGRTKSYRTKCPALGSRPSDTWQAREMSWGPCHKRRMHQANKLGFYSKINENPQNNFYYKVYTTYNCV